MQSRRMQFGLRQMMIFIALMAAIFAIVYYNTIGSYYGPGGQQDREFGEAERLWKADHPGQPYPTLAPLTPDPPMLQR
jgi:hypothetical protein